MQSPRVSLILILLGLYIFAYVPVPDSLDGEALLAVASSLVRRGSADMNVIAYTDWIMPPNAGMGQLGLDGEVYSKKGIAPSLALAPFVLAADLLPPLTARAVSMLINPLTTALTASILYSILRRLGFSTWVSWLTSFLYGSATMAVVYTGTLFGEPLAAFAIASAVLAFARWCDTGSPRDLLLLGASFALLIGINLVYTALVPLGALFILLASWRLGGSSPIRVLRVFVVQNPFLRFLTNGLIFALPIALALIATALFNTARFGSPFTGGYRFAEGEGFIYPIPLGLFGMFLSAYRGVFWYNPILFAAIPGVFMLLRRRPLLVQKSVSASLWFNRLSLIFPLSLAAGVAIAFAGWWSWHGGIVWGPRFLLPALPVFALCLAPVVDRVITNRATTRAASHRRFVRAVFIALIIISAAVQLLGVLIPYLPHYAYLKDNFFNPDPNALVGSLDDRVLTDPSLSPILGHAQLLFSGFPLQPGWISRGFDPIYLLAAALLIIPGLFLLRSPSPVQNRFFAPRSSRATRSPLLRRGVGGEVSRFFSASLRFKFLASWRLGGSIPVFAFGFCLFLAVCSLSLVAWRGSATQPERASLDSLAAAVGDADSIVLATSHYGASLIDLETRAHVVTINAPTSEDDERARQIWQTAWDGKGKIAYVTWMPPADPQDWIARDAFRDHAYISETTVDNHRAIRFLNDVARLDYPAGQRFGSIELLSMGIERRSDHLVVSLLWSVDSVPASDYAWFVHVLDASGNILAQQDRAPLGGFYPTSQWTPQVNPSDDLAFALPDPSHAAFLRIGWIDPSTGERLPAFAPDGTPLPDDFVVIQLRL